VHSACVRGATIPLCAQRAFHEGAHSSQAAARMEGGVTGDVAWINYCSLLNVNPLIRFAVVGRAPNVGGVPLTVLKHQARIFGPLEPNRRSCWQAGAQLAGSAPIPLAPMLFSS